VPAEDAVRRALAIAADLALQVVASLYEFCQSLPVRRVVVGNTLPPTCVLYALFFDVMTEKADQRCSIS
jgi:hypothetical protein